jgi:hypothetical protein
MMVCAAVRVVKVGFDAYAQESYSQSFSTWIRPSMATSGLYGTEYAVSTQRALLSCRFRPLWLKEECNYEK